MKFMHLADLHLGKKLCGFSLYEDQKYILQQILQIADEQQPDCVLVAGDVYDKSVPACEAVELFDAFLSGLAARHLPVCITSGNHDSAGRLAFGARLMAPGGVHFATAYDGRAQCVTLHDKYGAVDIYLLPFLKPSLVKHFLPPDEADKIISYNDAVAYALAQLPLDDSRRNVLVAHQYVTGAFDASSGEVNVGGVDNVGADVFAAFDYVALGHIHGAYSVGTECVRYAGAPLKYSLKEHAQQKSLTMVILDEEGKVTAELIPLTPLRELHALRGSYSELMHAGSNDSTRAAHDFYYITLTDEQDVTDAALKLRTVYCNLLQLSYDNQRTRAEGVLTESVAACALQPLELAAAFYEQQNNHSLSAQQQDYLKNLLAEMEGEEQ